jgi:hypothetical protein
MKHLEKFQAIYINSFSEYFLPAGRIIISPDGQYFPFEALTINGTDQPIKWFLEDYAVSYTYSARFLINDFNSGQTSGRNFLGIAPVNYPSAFSLAALPGSDHSLNRIGDYFNNAVSRVALDASRRNFETIFAIQNYSTLHHASDSSMNNEPVIYLPILLCIYPISLMKISRSPSLSCYQPVKQEKEKVYQGEGVFSFNRGFAALGIPAAITNLWSVDNESTYGYRAFINGLRMDCQRMSLCRKQNWNFFKLRRKKINALLLGRTCAGR